MELMKCRYSTYKSEMRVVSLKDSKVDNSLLFIKSNETFQQNKIYTNAEVLYSQFKSQLNKLNDSDIKMFSINNIYISLLEWERIINSKYIIRNNSIINLISNPCFLLFSFSKLREKGIKSPGLDNLNLNSITIGTIKRLSREIRSGLYKPSPSKRVYINKPNGGKRPLGIPSSRDKIVQMALLLILDPIFDRTFYHNSYGFRKGLDCHSCLLNIRRY